MPTVYTEKIENGEITTGKEFLKLCTKALNVSAGFEPNTYYKEVLEDSIANYDKFSKISFEDAKIEMIRAYADRVNTYKNAVINSMDKNQKYYKVREEVESWIPPTEEHINLKKFALEQIDMCIDSQELIDECLAISNEKLDSSKSAIKAFINEQIEFYRKRIDEWQELWDEEVKRAEANKLWVKQFLDSLK